MTRSPSVLRCAVALLNARLVLKQIGLGLLVFLLYALWLHVPDASVLDVIGSGVLAVIVVSVAGGGEAALVLSLAGEGRTPRKLLRGAMLLLSGVALWFAWSAMLDHLHGDDYLRAGYLNSRLPHSLRYFFTFRHLVLWLGWTWASLEWIGAGVIAIFVFAATARRQPVRSIRRALRCSTYWLATVLGTGGAVVLTGWLMQWTPGHGLRVEMLSLVMRLSLAVLVDATVLSFLLAILAVCVRETDTPYATPAGTPDESQPRTAELP